MKLAFYYHIPLRIDNNQVFAPAYIGLFIEELAKNVTELVVVMHTAAGKEIHEADYGIQATNITVIDLGKKTPAWHRSLLYRSVLKNALSEIENCDALLVRAPSPLAAAFRRLLKKTKVFFLIVGDYGEGAQQIGKKGIKNFLLHSYFTWTDRRFRGLLHKTDTFVNSPQLLEKYQHQAKSIALIKTTTLRSADFFQKENFQLHNPIQLLYTGRIEKSKGLTELVEATAQLVTQGLNVHLNIVGWEQNSTKPFEKELLALALQLDIFEHLTFHGKKQVGAELNKMYRMADIYVLPSYHEGFPRTIWEAMANALPVIATNVGGIPYYLKDEHDAILIQSKNSSAIAIAVLKLAKNETLRGKIVQNGKTLALSNTIEIQTKILIDKLKMLS